jgi:hypothetical protein
MPWEEIESALTPSSAIFGVQTRGIGLNRQRKRGRGQTVCTDHKGLLSS